MTTDTGLGVETVSARFGGFVRTHGSANTDDWDFLYPGLRNTGRSSHVWHRHNEIAKLWGFVKPTRKLVRMMGRRTDIKNRLMIRAGMSSSEVDQIINPIPGWQYLWPDEFKAKFDERRRRQGLPPVPWKQESEDLPPNRSTQSDTDRHVGQEGMAPAAVAPGGTSAAIVSEGADEEAVEQNVAAAASGSPHLGPQPASLQVQAVSVKYGGFVRTHGSANTDDWDFLYPGLLNSAIATSTWKLHTQAAQVWGFAEPAPECMIMMSRRQSRIVRSKIRAGMSSSEVDKVVNPLPGWQYLWPDEFKSKFDERRRRQGLPPVPWKEERDDLPPNSLRSTQSVRNTRQRAGVVRTTEARAPGGSRAARLTDSEQQSDDEMQNAAAGGAVPLGSNEVQGSQLVFGQQLGQPSQPAPHPVPQALDSAEPEVDNSPPSKRPRPSGHTTHMHKAPAAQATPPGLQRQSDLPPPTQPHQLQPDQAHMPSIPAARADAGAGSIWQSDDEMQPAEAGDCPDTGHLHSQQQDRCSRRYCPVLEYGASWSFEVQGTQLVFGQQLGQPSQPAPHPVPQALDSAEPEVDDSPPSKRPRPSGHTTHMHKAPAAQATPPGLQRQSDLPPPTQPHQLQPDQAAGTPAKQEAVEHMPLTPAAWPAARAGSTPHASNSSEDEVMVVREVPCVQLPDAVFDADGSISPGSYRDIVKALIKVLAYLRCTAAVSQLVDTLNRPAADNSSGSREQQLLFTSFYAELQFYWEQQELQDVRRVLRDRYQLQV